MATFPGRATDSPMKRKEFADRIQNYFQTQYPEAQQSYIGEWLKEREYDVLGVLYDHLLRTFIPTNQNPIPGIAHFEEGLKALKDKVKSLTEARGKTKGIVQKLTPEEEAIVSKEYAEFLKVVKDLEEKKDFKKKKEFGIIK